MRAAAVLLLLLAFPALAPCAETHAFFYLWYGTPAHDGNWSHWDHSILPHWTEAVRAQYPGAETRYRPPADIHAPFYPARGLYSSLDAEVLRAQFEELGAHGVAAAVVSWWGREGVSAGDSQGRLTDAAVERALAAAAATGGRVGVALHLEPYAGRSVESVRADLAHLRARFGAHPGLHRLRGRPVFYVYDSYHQGAGEWARLLTPGGDLTVRGGELDGVFLGLWLERSHGRDLAAGGFDGGYTYFASDGQSYGATAAHWPAMAEEARALGLQLVPSVGPGYDDSKIRPWNAAAGRAREGGEYYARQWRAALAARASIVSVTSYNEWGEGTQVEGAVPRAIDVDALAPLGQALGWEVRRALRLAPPAAYSDYGEGGPQLYMELTRRFAQELRAAAEGGADGAGAEL